MPERLKILGLGRYVPERVVEAQEIEARCGLVAGWVERMTGVTRRHWISGERAPQMGARAAREALSDAGLEIRDIDLILNASGSAAQAIPDGGALLQRELGPDARGIAAFSVHATCLSFVVALDLASTLIATGRHRRILIVSSEIGSVGIDFGHPESASLFGDLATAVVVGPSAPEESSAIHASCFETYSDGIELCSIDGGGTSKHPNHGDTRPGDNLFRMEGPRVYRLAHKVVPGVLERLRPGLSRGLSGIDWVVPHQASVLAVRSLRKFGFPDDRVIMNLGEYGNCIAASIPGALYDGVRDGKIVRGSQVLLIGTGAGLSVGGVVLTY